MPFVARKCVMGFFDDLFSSDGERPIAKITGRHISGFSLNNEAEITVQLFNDRIVFKSGSTYLSESDIDDILLNVLGAAIGFMLYKLFDQLTKSKFRIKSPNAVELTFCILFVFASRFLLFNEMGLAKLLYGF